MKILITGGAGYVGTDLVQRLAQDPNVTEVVIYDNLSRPNYNLFLSEKFSNAPIRFVKGELLDTRKLKKSLEGVEVVYHLAAKVTTPFAHQDAHAFEQTNQWGTAELSYLLEESSVKTLVYLSSVSVYGSSNEEVTEEAIPNPHTYYGISKLLGERMLERFFDSDIKTYVIRCGNVYGYNKSMRFDAVINKFMFEAHFNGKVTVQGNGNQKRSFIHVNQVGAALSKIINRTEIDSGIYNLVARVLSINEVTETVKSLYPEIDTQYVQQSLEMKSLVVNPSTKLSDYNLFTPSDFYDDLLAFKGQFAF